MNHRVTASHRVRSLRLSGGTFEDAEPPVVIEAGLHLIVNGTGMATTAIMPGMEHEFVTGHLFSQGFIDTLDDIEHISIHGNTAHVRIRQQLPPPATDLMFSSGGRTIPGTTPLPRLTSDLKVQPATVFIAMNRLFESASVYRETEGVHAAGIFTAQAEPLCVMEDIGRHNCLDKVIGWALLNGVDTGICLLAATGRMTSEMVTKICRAGIPFAASKTAVTDRGVAIAEACGMTLAGFVRDAGTRIEQDMETKTVERALMRVYTGVERVSD